MAAVVTKKVNNCKVRTIPHEGGEDKRPIKGYELCPCLYANIYLVAKKNSGKTTVIWNIIDRCTGRDTIIFAWVSTLNNDANWRTIRKMCEDRGIPFIGSTSLMNDGVDELEALIHSLQKKAADEDEKDEAPPRTPFPCLPVGAATESKTRKPPRTKYQAPELIIILDDLADELKKTSVATLLKKNRHFKSKVIISSQWLNDIPPTALGQMSLVCLFRGFSVEKLEEFHSKARLSLPLEEFITMYKDATSDDFGFLCIDTDNNTYRKKFDQAYTLE
jgi:hypothetical protein